MTELGQNSPAVQRKARLLYVAPEDWFFENHFLGLARAAHEAGYEVALVARLGPAAKRLQAEGIDIYPLGGSRGSLSIASGLLEIRSIRQAMRAFTPDLTHILTVRSILLTLFARLGLPPHALVMAPTGLGYLFSSDRLHLRMLRAVLTRMMQKPPASTHCVLLAENRDDPAVLGFPTPAIGVEVVGGAGIPSQTFAPLPMREVPPFRFAVVARMLHSKGIQAAADALALARQHNDAIALHLYGKPDPANPTSLSEEQMAELARQPGVTWHGETADIAGVWAENHAAILLSEREGMPRMLAEAAACGRPILATDVPGCREIVEPGRNGFLVPFGASEETAGAMLKLASDVTLARDMGAYSRQIFEERFTLERVAGIVLQAYARLLDETLP